MPCEPDPAAAQCQRVRQPWYPVEERYGLVFAYLGPPERKPVLPRYECLEVLEPGEFVEADDSSIGSGGIVIAPCNWLQHFENVVDPYHVPILHGSFSGPQFVEQMAALPKVKFEYSRRGVKATSIRRRPDGSASAASPRPSLPTLRVVPNPQGRRSTAWSSRSAGPCRSTTRTTASTSPAACARRASWRSSSRATTARPGPS